MVRDYVREQRGRCKTLRVTSGVRARAFLGLPFFLFIFCLLDLSNIGNGGALRVPLGSSLRGVLLKQYSLRIGNFAGEVLDFCEKS